VRHAEILRFAVIRARPLLRTLGMIWGALLVASVEVQAAACTANDGRPVRFRASVTIPDIALATIDRDSGERLIYYNPYVIAWLPPQLRAWIHAHECAHHALDHLRHGEVTAAQEIEADCWATRELTARGVLSPADIALMEHAIARLLPAHWMHMPGRFRAIELQKCVSYPARPLGWPPDLPDLVR
jgi:hypothetical protein